MQEMIQCTAALVLIKLCKMNTSLVRDNIISRDKLRLISSHVGGGGHAAFFLQTFLSCLLRLICIFIFPSLSNALSSMEHRCTIETVASREDNRANSMTCTLGVFVTSVHGGAPAVAVDCTVVMVVL